jgi:hypothetical protein
LLTFDATQEMFMREQLGMVTRSESRAFTQQAVERFANSARSLTTEEIEHLFVAIDPAGGGSSCLAIVSGVMSRSGELIITSGDSLKINTDEARSFSLARLAALNLSPLRISSAPYPSICRCCASTPRCTAARS